MSLDDSISSTWWLIAIALTLVLLGMLLLVAAGDEDTGPDGATLTEAVAHVGPAVAAAAMGGGRRPPAPARRAPYAGRHRSEP